MRRIFHQTAVAQLPAVPALAGTSGFFTGGNPGAGLPATVVPDWWLNGIQEELMAFLTATGITPDATTAQVLAACRAMFSTALRVMRNPGPYTFTPRPGQTTYGYLVLGGGGGGGAATATGSAASGGCGGGLSIGIATGVTGPVSGTVGAGGIGSNSNANGTAGGSSTFGSWGGATGGAGGYTSAGGAMAVVGSAGIGSAGFLDLPGQGGGTGQVIGGTYLGGSGGGSAISPGVSIATGASGTGAALGGGGGGAANNGTGGGNGGNGGPGLVLVWG
ncbi:glycine-rich domain-containing protein [Muricoccus vinaceus]|uniref:Uncharacterized protein n=1 Tax=Muricoccus vinaceus TaxID=424704 RepID=A0ABV6INI4_9PROT